MKAKMKKGLMGLGVATLSVGSAMATPILENDSLEGLGQYGTDIGGFLTNLTPGLVKFIFAIAIIGSIIGIIVAIAMVIKKLATKGMNWGK